MGNSGHLVIGHWEFETMRTPPLLGVAVTLAVLAVIGCRSPQAAPFDLVVRGGELIDGTGGPARRADVGVRGDAIVEIGALSRSTATRVIDAAGMVVAPGFIDMHSHSDLPLLVDGRSLSKITQGVTTELLGESDSPAPVIGHVRGEVERSLGGLGLRLDWTTFAEYFQRLERQQIAVNVVALVGAGQVRAAVVGFDKRAPSANELSQMQALVDRAMQDGAAGLSSGLIYVPNSYASTEELIELARVAARHGGIYVSHIRNEDDGLLVALREAATIGREAGLPVEVLHLKRNLARLDGAAQATTMREAIGVIEEARQQGVKMAANVYPYAASQTTLNANLLPQWALEGGREQLLTRLRDPRTRARIRSESQAILTSPLSGRRADTVMLARTSHEPHQRFQGMRIKQIADDMKEDASGALLDIIDKSDGLASGIYFGMREEDVALALTQPWTTIGSDGSGLAPTGILARSHPHPRSYGTFPRVLGHYVREARVLTLPQAIHKMTGLPAERLGLADRGTVKVANKADLVVFDPGTISDRATFDQPHQLSVGVQWLVVNGALVIDKGAPTGTLPGRVLRHTTTARAQ
jgi:dihydroorotase/N-acyl-D-amino-acid deacylase